MADFQKAKNKARTTAHEDIFCGVDRWCGNHFACDQRSSSLEFTSVRLTERANLSYFRPTSGCRQQQHRVRRGCYVRRCGQGLDSLPQVFITTGVAQRIMQSPRVLTRKRRVSLSAELSMGAFMGYQWALVAASVPGSFRGLSHVPTAWAVHA